MFEQKNKVNMRMYINYNNYCTFYINSVIEKNVFVIQHFVSVCSAFCVGGLLLWLCVDTTN